MSAPAAPAAPDEAFSARLAQTDDGPMRYVQAGQGDDIVLLHGAMMSLEDMVLGPFERLAQRFRVTAFDRPGHGETPRRRLDGAPSRQAQHVLAAMDALGIERAVIVGHSFGATLAMTMAVAVPERVAGVLAISPLAFPEVRMEHLLYGPRAVVGAGDLLAYGPGRAMDAALLPGLWHAIFAPQAMPPRFAARYPFAVASGASQMQALGEEALLALPELAGLAASYRRCRPRVRVLAGSADWLAPPWMHAARLAAAVPDGRLRLLPGLGHMLHHFAGDAIVDAVEDLVSPRAAAA